MVAAGGTRAMKSTFVTAFELLNDAIFEVREKSRELLRALILPAVGSVVVALSHRFVEEPGANQWLLLAAHLAFYALFAVSCHRIILLGRDSLPSEFGLYWSMRETRFAAWLILLFFLYAALSYPFAFATVFLPRELMATQIPWYAWTFVLTYFEGRFSMVLPATAVEQRMNLPASWILTRGRGLAIAMALFATSLAMTLITIVVKRILFKDAYVLGEVVDAILVFPIVAVAVGVISVTYRKVTFQE